MKTLFEKIPELDEFAEVCGYLSQRGWSEGSGGNLSFRIKTPSYIATKHKNTSNPVALPVAVPELAGQSLLISGTETRAREIALRPAENIGLYIIADDGQSFYWLAGNKNPTSELPSHCAIHQTLCRYRPEQRAIIHTHPPLLIALTQCAEFQKAEHLSELILSMQSEARLQLPEGVGLLDFHVPGSLELGEASAKLMQYHQIILWYMHGALASGKTLSHALDQLEVINKAAEIFWILKSAGCEPCGMSRENMQKSLSQFGRLQRYEQAFNYQHRS